MQLYKKSIFVFLIFLSIFGCTSDDSGEITEDAEEQGEMSGDEMDDEPEDEMDDEVLSAQLLVFTKTEGFRHASIDDGVAALMDLGSDNDFSITETEDSADFNQENLEKYQLVVFLSTTQDVLNDEQQTAFENYIRSGGSFMGIHAATDTEYDWPWYGQLVGAYFNGHPNVQEASMMVLDMDHPATAHLPDTWMRRDEWYNFRNINPNINVLVNLDETSYSGGENGENHPIAWYHEFDGGRSFYTAGGHTAASFGEPDFRQHLLGGILYCLGRAN